MKGLHDAKCSKAPQHYASQRKVSSALPVLAAAVGGGVSGSWSADGVGKQTVRKAGICGVFLTPRLVVTPYNPPFSPESAGRSRRAMFQEVMRVSGEKAHLSGEVWRFRIGFG